MIQYKFQYFSAAKNWQTNDTPFDTPSEAIKAAKAVYDKERQAKARGKKGVRIRLLQIETKIIGHTSV